MKNATCGVDEARTHLPELIDRAKAGTITIITPHQSPQLADPKGAHPRPG